MLTEGHLFLPFAVLCYSKTYLAMWAHLGPALPTRGLLPGVGCGGLESHIGVRN